MPSKRALRGREKRQRRRVEAAARVPQMLTEEQALRQQLDDLLRKADAFSEHAQYDQQITALTERSQELMASFLAQLRGLAEMILEVMAIDAGFLTGHKKIRQQSCQRAFETIRALESMTVRIQENTIRTAELVVDRAEISVVPVDREDLARRIDEMVHALEAFDTAVAEKRAQLIGLCSDAVPEEMT